MLAVLPWKYLWSGKTENPPMSAHTRRLNLAELHGRLTCLIKHSQGPWVKNWLQGPRNRCQVVDHKSNEGLIQRRVEVRVP